MATEPVNPSPLSHGGGAAGTGALFQGPTVLIEPSGARNAIR
jgi:hypothetical protein